MDLEVIKSQLRELSPEDRRKVALYILELEKDHFQQNVGPQIKEDLESFSRVIQEAAGKIKDLVDKNLR